MADYLKDLLGKEDLSFDTGGTDATFARTTSDGNSQNITKLNASQLPLILATRTLALYNSGALSATEVDTAITQLAASLASIHKFSNQDQLDLITSAGSGAVITVSERAKINAILGTGSGTIISSAERAKLATLAALTDEQINILNNIDSLGSPVGSIITYASDSVPNNYLECDGRDLSRALYSDLYGAIGTKYGVGNGTTTFGIPDLRGKFVRGWDHGAGNDPDAGTRTDRGDGTTGDEVGTLQADGVGPHTHTTGEANGPTGGGTNWLRPSGGTTATDANTGNETRPVNVNMMYCIRYRISA